MVGAEVSGVQAMAIGGQIGAGSAAPVGIGQVELEAPLVEIVSARRAINVQVGETEYGSFVARGDVGGMVVGETLAFGLDEVNGSGFSGVAIRRGGEKGVVVTVYLSQGSVERPMGATPVGGGRGRGLSGPEAYAWAFHLSARRGQERVLVAR